MMMETIGKLDKEILKDGAETSRFFKNNGELIRIKVKQLIYILLEFRI